MCIRDSLRLGQVRPGSRLLETERKLLTHGIRMSAYNAESALARLLRPHYSRGDDEARALPDAVEPSPRSASSSPTPEPATPAPTSPSPTASKATQSLHDRTHHVRSSGDMRQAGPATRPTLRDKPVPARRLGP